MSHVTLQRVLVRMFFDAAFAARVYAGPADALPGLELSATELRWLVSPDARAYRTDTTRRARSLTVVVEEYPSSCAVRIARGGSIDELDAYFSSEEFHAEIQERGSLVGGFGPYFARTLRALDDPALHALLALEHALVTLRRRAAGPAPPEGSSLRLHQEVEVLVAPQGTLDLSVEVRRRLGVGERDPVEVMLRPGFRSEFRASTLPPVDPTGAEPLLLEVRAGEATVGEIGDELGALLEHAREARSRDELVAEAVRLGADPGEATGIVDGLVVDRLLQRAG